MSSVSQSDSYSESGETVVVVNKGVVLVPVL